MASTAGAAILVRKLKLAINMAMRSTEREMDRPRPELLLPSGRWGCAYSENRRNAR